MGGAVAGALIIAVAGTFILKNDNDSNAVENSKVTNNKVVASSKEENKSKTDKSKDETTKTLDELKSADKANMSDNEKKAVEEQIKAIESSNDNSKEVATNENSTSNNNTNVGNTNNNQNNNNNTPAHTHSWNPINSVVYHDEVGHWEDTVITGAWTEEVPVYEEREVAICNGCGIDITDDIYNHTYNALVNGNTKCGAWHSEWKQIQVGTNVINNPAITEKRWIVDKAAWSEAVTNGYSCSCGAIK